MSSRSWLGRGRVVVAALLGSALGLILASRPLASATSGNDLLGGATVAVTGAAMAPAYPALLSACAAAALALALAGRRLRPVVAVVLIAGGLAAEFAWRTGLAAAGAALERAAAASGTVGSGVRDVQVAWGTALVGDAAAVLVAAAGAAALWFGGSWQGASARYDADAVGGLRTDPRGVPDEQGHGQAPRQRPGQEWEALSRGEDPTL